MHFAQTRFQTQERALATAAGTQQHEELARVDPQRHIVDDRRPVVAFGYLLESDGHNDGSRRVGSPAAILESPCDRVSSKAVTNWLWTAALRCRPPRELLHCVQGGPRFCFARSLRLRWRAP